MAFPVTTTQSSTTKNDASGTITTGGTSQIALAANVNLVGYEIQNLSMTTTLWINDTGSTAASFTPSSIGLAPGSGSGTTQAPGGYVSSATVAAIALFSTQTGHPFTLKWW
jgi:hypothetical protein